MRIIKTILISLLFFPVLAFAADNFVEGKDYQRLEANTTIEQPAVPKGKVQVIEFFNYGCPFCFNLETNLENWLKHKAKNVQFERVPVAFEPGWDNLAKAYYTAKSLGILDKMTPAIFNAIHQQGVDLTQKDALEKFFVEHGGVSKQDFNSVYDFSPGIGMALQQGKQLMLAYKVFVIPSFVVDGKYKTDAQMVNGDDKRLLAVLNYLIQKESAES